MRILIVSDVHANLAALEAVLHHADSGGGIAGVWSLGDCVGYGPQPSQCIARLTAAGAVMVAGNHERAATGAIGTEEFNPDAAAAAEWTKARLSDGEKAALDALPEIARIEGVEFTLVHGTLREPIWEYLYSYEAAAAHLALQESQFGLVGHTHIPAVALEDERAPLGNELYRLADGEAVELTGDAKLVLNPGSVGQPRDGDARASYAVYDSDQRSVTLHRVEYDIASTQRLMKEAGLPRWLIERLALGR